MKKTLADEMRTLSIKTREVREFTNRLFHCAQAIASVIHQNDYNELIDTIRACAKMGGSGIVWHVSITRQDLQSDNVIKLLNQHKCSDLTNDNLAYLLALISKFLLLNWSKLLLAEGFIVGVDQYRSMSINWK